jgi:hypothetical protein
LRIHCLYRDFFLFLKMMNLEKDKWRSFKRHYYDKHSQFLSQVWLKYQGLTARRLRSLVRSIEKSSYEKVENLLKVYDIEENTKEVILRCKDLLHYPDLCNIYLYIGFLSPVPFVMRYHNSWVICVGLDQFAGFDSYPVVLSYQFCHYIQCIRKKEPEKDLLHSLIQEGIAVYFSKQAYPGYDEHLYLFLSEHAYRWLKDHCDEIVKKAIRGVIDSDLFYPGSPSEAFHSGPFVGYRIVTEWIRKSGETRVETLIESTDRIGEAAGMKQNSAV